MRMKPPLLMGMLIAVVLPLLAIQSDAPGNKEAEAFSKAAQITDPAEKIKALEGFLEDYPTSNRRRTVYGALVDAYLKKDKDPKALEYADKLIQAAPERGRAGVLNNVAWQLVENDAFLDKALEYVNQAVDAARKEEGSKRALATYLDTMAWIEYKQGNFASAEKTQREAVSYLPSGPADFLPNLDYHFRLGVILTATGNDLDEAADLLAMSLLLGEPKEGRTHFDKMLAKLSPADPAAKKADLFKKAGDKYISGAPDKMAAQSKVAVGYARQEVQPDEALKLGRLVVDSLTSRSTVESVVDYNRTLGLVHFHQNHPKEALPYLQKAAALQSPFDQDLFIALGKSLEAQGQDQAALKAYLESATALQIPRLMEPMTALLRKLHGADASIKDAISAHASELSNFKPQGAVKSAKAGFTVLAELFTGSECSPCVAADIGFDHALDAYDRKALTVLEYHLHIPGPDPMTNRDTEARARYYQTGGTPTVFIAGTDRVRGGGPKAASKNRFGVYSFVIDRHLENPPTADIVLSGKLDRGAITVKAEATATDQTGDLKLRIALVEERVHYEGSNKIVDHRFVVRKLVGSPEGVALTEGKAAHTETFELAALVDNLRVYLEEFETNNAERLGATGKFKEKKHEIDPANLSLIAFVQDDKTRAVLQSAYVKLGAGQSDPSSQLAR